VSATAVDRLLRIGEVAERSGVTPRTIRYYEEIGLLASGPTREKGKHRLYDEADVERVRELTRLRDLLGVTLDELKQLVAAEDARAVLRRRFHETESQSERLRLVDEALPHVDAQLELVRKRIAELRKLERELEGRRTQLQKRRRELRG
jgi:DNA-binding transcriptional MerR regulator